MSKYLESCNNECKIVMLLLVVVLGYLLYQCYNKNKACAREGFAKVGTYVEISFDEYYSLAKKYGVKRENYKYSERIIANAIFNNKIKLSEPYIVEQHRILKNVVKPPTGYIYATADDINYLNNIFSVNGTGNLDQSINLSLTSSSSQLIKSDPSTTIKSKMQTKVLLNTNKYKDIKDSEELTLKGIFNNKDIAILIEKQKTKPLLVLDKSTNVLFKLLIV